MIRLLVLVASALIFALLAFSVIDESVFQWQMAATGLIPLAFAVPPNAP